jgi:hypothetical protein
MYTTAGPGLSRSRGCSEVGRYLRSRRKGGCEARVHAARNAAAGLDANSPGYGSLVLSGCGVLKHCRWLGSQEAEPAGEVIRMAASAVGSAFGCEAVQPADVYFAEFGVK